MTGLRTYDTGRLTSSSIMNARRYSALIILSAAIVAADQITKLVVRTYFLPNQGLTVIKGVLNLVYVRNPGGAFGFFSKGDPSAVLPFFLLVSIATAVLIVYFYGRLSSHSLWYRYALSFILGGAAGNLIDRLRDGKVIDFIDLHVGNYHWPAFNVADACITAGAIMFLMGFLRPSEQ